MQATQESATNIMANIMVRPAYNSCHPKINGNTYANIDRRWTGDLV
jgi:hypothetical protein